MRTPAPYREPILMEDGTPATGALGTPYLLIRQRHGRFAVSQGNNYCIDNTTKAACLTWTRDAVNGRLKREADAAAERAAMLEKVAARGLTAVDYRQVQPGDLFTVHPFGEIRTVTGVTHNDNGSSVIVWDRDQRPGSGDLGCALMIPGFPACYGKHQMPALRRAVPQGPNAIEKGEA